MPLVVGVRCAASHELADGVDVTRYSWTFGDGESGEGEAIEHTYAAGGEYIVRLTIDLSRGDPVSTSRTVRVIESADLPILETFDSPEGPEIPGWTVSSGSWSITDDERLEVSTEPGTEAHIWLGNPPLLV